MVLDSTVVEHISELVAGIGIGSRDDIRARLAFSRAAFIDEGTSVVVNIATTAEVVNGAVNLGIFPIELVVGIGIIGILIREHLDVLADGPLSLILQADSASASQSGTLCTIVVESILQGQVLHIETRAGVQQGCCSTDTLDADVRSILDDGAFH